jgi:hypothetical protein
MAEPTPPIPEPGDEGPRILFDLGPPYPEAQRAHRSARRYKILQQARMALDHAATALHHDGPYGVPALDVMSFALEFLYLDAQDDHGTPEQVIMTHAQIQGWLITQALNPALDKRVAALFLLDHLQKIKSDDQAPTDLELWGDTWRTAT